MNTEKSYLATPCRAGVRVMVLRITLDSLQSALDRLEIWNDEFWMKFLPNLQKKPNDSEKNPLKITLKND